MEEPRRKQKKKKKYFVSKIQYRLCLSIKRDLTVNVSKKRKYDEKKSLTGSLRTTVTA